MLRTARKPQMPTPEYLNPKPLTAPKTPKPGRLAHLLTHGVEDHRISVRNFEVAGA